MVNSRELKHNDVVIQKENNGWAFYGRVWKRLDNNHVVVIDCGKYVQIYHESELVLSSYKGDYMWQHYPGNDYGNPTRFLFMPNLRKLKKAARRFNPNLEPSRWESRA